MNTKVLIEPINILNDAMFKAIMINPNNREMVVDVIHALTGIDKKKLREATYIGGEEIPKRNVLEKAQRTDMTIRISKNFQILVEMNQSYSDDIFLKNTDYALSRIVENTPINSLVYPKIIIINIDNFNKFKTDKPILEFMIRDNEGNIETEMYKSIHLILANARVTSYNIDKEIRKFTRFLKCETTIKELEETFKGDKKYMAAIRTVKDLSTDPEFSGYYSIEEAHRQDLESAKATGIRIGTEKGIGQGIIQGIKQNSLETAKNLLAMQVLSVEQIASATNLTIEELEKLKSASFK